MPHRRREGRMRDMREDVIEVNPRDVHAAKAVAGINTHAGVSVAMHGK